MMKIAKTIYRMIRAILLRLSKRHRVFLALFRKFTYCAERFNYARLVKKYSILENLILFDAMLGGTYGCNIKPIYLELLGDERYSGYRHIWAFKDPKRFKYLKKENPNLVLVKYGSGKHKIAMARAKYIFASSGLPSYYYRRKDQIYFQCWHGTALKKLGCDVVNDGGAVFTAKEVQKKYRHDAKRMSYLLAPSPYMKEKLTSAFDLKRLKKESIIFSEGYPRNDIFFKFAPEDVARVKESLSISPNKKVILYAPTFRDSDFERGKGYLFETPFSFDRLQEKLGEECVILFRPHVLIADRFDFSQYEGFVINVATYSDIYELSYISDLLITDYSSILFDYANLKRPMLFYMYDLEEYGGEIRGLYMDVHELPGPIVTREEDLLPAIEMQLHSFEYDARSKAFNEKFNPLDCLDCSKKIVEHIVSQKGN